MRRMEVQAGRLGAWRSRGRARSAWQACLVAVLGVMRTMADGFVEEFDSDPSARGWGVLGDGAAFRWDARGWLGVEWDSTRPNGFLARALPGPVTEHDDFSLGFDLILDAHAVGVAPGKPGTFPMAAGLVRRADVLAPSFRRGVFLASRNLVEWAWFGTEPSGWIAASISPVVVPSDGRLPWGYADSFVEPRPGVRYGFDLVYTAADRTLRGTMTEDGLPGPALRPVVLPVGFTGFEVDAWSVNAYSDAGQDPRYAGSLRASARVDRIRWEGPGPVVSGMRLEWGANGARVRFGTRRGWRYLLQASEDLGAAWSDVSGPRLGDGAEVVLEDPGAGAHRFYRVEARRP